MRKPWARALSVCRRAAKAFPRRLQASAFVGSISMAVVNSLMAPARSPLCSFWFPRSMYRCADSFCLDIFGDRAREPAIEAGPGVPGFFGAPVDAAGSTCEEQPAAKTDMAAFTIEANTPRKHLGTPGAGNTGAQAVIRSVDHARRFIKGGSNTPAPHWENWCRGENWCRILLSPLHELAEPSDAP